MASRRDFLKISLLGATGVFSLPAVGQSPSTGIKYQLQLDVATRLFDGKQCWTHPRAGLVPGAGKNGLSRVVMTMNTLDLDGDDVFKGMYGLYSDDLSSSWTEPTRLTNLDPRYEIIDGEKRPVAVSDFWPKYHRASGKLLGTGHTVVYTPEWEVELPRPRHTSFSVYDPENNQWSAWRKLDMPDPVKFADAGAGCVQRYHDEDGTILLPIYYRPPNTSSLVTIFRCSFDGSTLKYLEHGDEISIDDDTRGMHEPSITRFQNEYFLTIRNDKRGYVTRSKNGLHYESVKEWRFDDGSELGNYNTQQHWVTHSEGLFLVYTRRGANNDHIFRNRAPLFMAQVDPDRLCVIRETERILVPERGARLGNFGVTDISPQETWVTVSEWMQPKGVEKYGSDGSVYVARIFWEQPNALIKN